MTAPPHSLKGWRGKSRHASRLTAPVPSPREREQKAWANRLATLLRERGQGTRLRIAATEAQREEPNLLAHENAVLLHRQHIIDVGRTDRSIGFMMHSEALEPEEEPEGIPLYGGFMHTVYFDRPEDAWPYYAGQRRGSRHKGDKK